VARLLGRAAGTVDVVVLPPVPTEGWRVSELDSHIDAIRRSYVDTFQELAGPELPAVEKEAVLA